MYKIGNVRFAALIVVIFSIMVMPALAEEAGGINSGDTAWVLFSAALVMLMTPAVGLFYGGMVRKKNVLAIIMQSFIILAIISIQWVLFGYSLAFGHDTGRGLIGGLEWLGLNGVGAAPNPDYAATIPASVFMIFQAMFAIITPALITGSFADRMKFSTMMVFSVLWATLVYDPVAHWVWGIGGWIRTLGALDFAGGTVVHITAGISAFAAAIIIGKRLGYGSEDMAPHNVPMTIIGGVLLWFGWFGFNAGSALAANGLAASAFIVTNTAAAAAALTWTFVSWTHGGKPNAVGIVTGGVAGLVAITPGSGFVGVVPAIIIGIGAGIFCYFAMHLRSKKTSIDDSLDVMACHGIGGIWGALTTGIFASVAINTAGADGLIYGNPGLVVKQIIAIVAVLAYSLVMTAIILKVLDATMGIRVKDEHEIEGLDVSQHGEKAYL
ncbi:Putative ammonium transporter [uncultured archaeon]|nr:Putative ammonium transporter [uncultured archaeon]